MVSQEFKTAVAEKNLLRVRIMLKDSFVVDPTFVQLDEMLSYARAHLPDLFVPFDGKYLETDKTKWNDKLMNEELVTLVTNFSETRVGHLKKVVAKVLETEATKIREKRKMQASRSKEKTKKKKEDTDTQKNILRDLQSEGRKIQEIMNDVTTKEESNGKMIFRCTWTPAKVKDMKRAAEKILKAAQDYEKNR